MMELSEPTAAASIVAYWRAAGQAAAHRKAFLRRMLVIINIIRFFDRYLVPARTVIGLDALVHVSSGIVGRDLA